MHRNKQAKGRTRRIRLIIVDGYLLHCTGLAALFRGAPNIEVVATANAADEAVQVAEQCSPDVILMDVSLPDRGAFKAAARILTSGLQTRVVFMDYSVCKANVSEAVRVGGAGYWTRHATFEELTEAVAHAAAGTLTFCPAVRSQVARDATGMRFDPAQGNGVLGKLSPREIEVMTHLAKGLSVKQCAQHMRLSASTGDIHRWRLMKKLDVHKATDLARLAVRKGLVAD